MVTLHNHFKCYSIKNDDTRTIGDEMPERTDWEEKAKGILRAEMARKGVTYAGLAERLAEIGVEDNERNLRNKVSRGKFRAGFLIQCLTAIEVNTIRL